MAGRRSFSELRARMSPDVAAMAAAVAEQLRAEMDLAELRQTLKLSQAELARKLHVGQAAVAKVEQRADMYVSTLRGYIEAIGGELEISAKIGGRRVQLKNFQQITGLRHPKATTKELTGRLAIMSEKRAAKQKPVRVANRKSKAAAALTTTKR